MASAGFILTRGEFTFPNISSNILGMDMRIIANSLPKSGTHVLIQLLNIIDVEESPPQLSASLISSSTTRNPIVKLRQLRRRSKNSQTGYCVNLDNPADKIRHGALTSILSRVPDNRFLSAHLPYTLELLELLDQAGFKILYIYRDPRDVAISYVNHMLRDSRYPLHRLFSSARNMDERLRIVLRGASYKKTGILSPLRERIEHSRGWIKCQQVCDVTFEEIIGEKGGGDGTAQGSAVSKVLGFLGYTNDEKLLQQVMQNIFEEKAETFHKGIIGQWREILSDRLKDEFKEEIGSQLIELDYERDYDW